MTSPHTPATILCDAVFPTDVERLFVALTDTTDLVHWYSQQAEFVPNPMGARFEGKDGHFLEAWVVDHMEPPRHLMVHWTSQADWFADVRLQVTFRVSPEGSSARCTVEATPLAGPPDRVDDALAEWRVAFDNLRVWLEAEEEGRLATQSLCAQAVFKAPAERVFRALTVPSELKSWFWDEAELAPAAGSPFRLRGAAQSQADLGTVLRVTANDSLVLDWNDGVSTRRVYWRLSEADAGGPLATTTWTVQDGPFSETEAWRRDMCATAWRNVQAALGAYLAAETSGAVWTPATVREEMSLRLEFDLPESAAVLWDALSQPARLSQWLAEEATADSGPLELSWPASAATRRAHSVRLDPQQSILFTWQEGALPTVVSVRNQPDGDHCHVRVHHWGFVGARTERDAVAAIWNDAVERLKRLLVTLQPPAETPAGVDTTSTSTP